MHVFIVYCHPSEDSFTRYVKDEFIRVLLSAQHTYEISDLYRKEYGHYNAMKTVMLGDRIFNRAENKEMIILDGTKLTPELRQEIGIGLRNQRLKWRGACKTESKLT